jgi:hypothetical protein
LNGRTDESGVKVMGAEMLAIEAGYVTKGQRRQLLYALNE